MNLDAILEVAIGLVAAWLTLSVAVSQIQEWISTWLGFRAKTLEKAITSMLKDGSLVQAFYAHPLVQSLAEPNGKRKPSYIQAADFATVMMDLIVKEGSSADQQVAATTSPSLDQRINAGIASMKQKYPGFGHMMDVHFPHLSNDLVSVGASATQAQTNMQNWYNAVQERASGWYKRQAIILSFVIGLIIALIFNIDTAQIATQLWKAPTVRQALIAQATTTTTSGSLPTNALTSLLNQRDYADSLAIPFGWSTVPMTQLNSAPASPAVQAAPNIQCGWVPGQNVHPCLWLENQWSVVVNLPAMDDLWGWLGKLIGILLSGLAAAQGAPFWFGILNKLVNLRGSGAAPAAASPTPAPAPAQAPADNTQTQTAPTPQPVG